MDPKPYQKLKTKKEFLVQTVVVLIGISKTAFTQKKIEIHQT
jgi:hypothetical protein